jgi:hypothetical protein
MCIDRLSHFERMPNVEWLIQNSDDRTPRMPTTARKLAAILEVDPARISDMRKGDRSMSPTEVDRFIAATGLLDVYPDFRVTWLDQPREQFAALMQSISYGRWKGDQPLDALSAKAKALTGASLVREAELSRMPGQAQRRGDLGADVPLDISVTGSIPAAERFGIAVSDVAPAMARSLWDRHAACLLLFRPVRHPLFKAARCPQDDCLHLLSPNLEPLRSYPPPASLRAKLRVVLAPATDDPRRPYGFATSNVPERLELLVLVLGQGSTPLKDWAKAIAPVKDWSKTGGDGLPEQRQAVRTYLARDNTVDTPKLCGRMLVDVVPP